MALSAAGSLSLQVAAAEPVYFNDFEDGAGPEWSSSVTDVTHRAVFTRFLGRFGNGGTTLTLNGLTPAAEYTLVFDLYAMDSWDGGALPNGDRFTVSADGTPILQHTIGGANPTFPRLPDERGAFGFSSWDDSIFRGVTARFVAAGETVAIAFEGANLQSLSDESWGLDNVVVLPGGAGAPTSVAFTSLPAQGAGAAMAIDRFFVTFTDALDPEMAVDSDLFELRSAGPDESFGTADDLTYALTATYAEGAGAISFSTSPGPLQPGQHRFRVLDGLLDAAGEPVEPFERSFAIVRPVHGEIEGLDNGVLPNATTLPLEESPAGSGLLTAYAIGTFQAAGDVDYWRFEAEAGDRVTIRLEASEVTGVNPRVQLRDAADQTLANVQGGSSTGIAQIQSFQIPASGSYYVRVWSDSRRSAYAMRVDRSRGILLEVEANDTQATSNPLPIRLTGVETSGRGAGALTSEDEGGDYFRLGHLNAGNAITASVAVPEGSSLVPADVTLAVEFEGNATPLASGAATVAHTAAETGVHYVRVTGANRGLRAQYVLTVQVTDSVAPAVTGTSLPADGSTTTDVVSRFTLTFSEDMDPAAVNDAGAYELRGAGADNDFGTPDDLTYSVAPDAYSGGLSASYWITDGPLQPGIVRFTAGSGVVDRAGNALTPFMTTFTVEPLPGFVLENRRNDIEAAATSLSPSPSITADGSFHYAGIHSAGGLNPYDIAAGDLNGDGFEDLVSANYSGHSVGVLLGRGDGTFEPVVTFPAGPYPIAVTIGDVNDDGDPDVVVANYQDNRVTILAGDGAGSLAEPVSVAVGANPRDVELADLDADGVVEIVTANSGDNDVTVLRRQAGGEYARTDFTTASGVWGVAVGDLNGDGSLDLVTANGGSGNISVLLGDGEGGFAPAVSYPVQSQPRHLALADMDGDGALDAVVLNASTRSVSVLLNQGDGTFGEAIHRDGLGSDSYHLAVGLVDADDAPDVIVASYGSRLIEVLRNEGEGVLAPAVPHQEPDRPIGIVTGDWNRDGVLDIATADYQDGNVTIRLGGTSHPLTEDPAGLWTGAGRGSMADGLDIWTFSASANDLLTLAVETPGSPASSQLQYVVIGPDGESVFSLVPSSNNGWGQHGPVTLGASGTYHIRVNPWDDYRGEYRLRVSLARQGLQAEAEGNDSPGAANVLSWSQAPGVETARIAGYIGVGDTAGDYYNLGNLAAGTTIRLRTELPASSALVPLLRILRADGTEVAAGTNELEHVIVAGESAVYHARVLGGGGAGVLGQYVLEAELADSAPPVVTILELPDEGTTSSAVIDRFVLGFSEDMLPESVNNPAHYEVRGAGGDGDFDTPDDVLYSVAPHAYTTGLSARFLLSDGPLQPGLHRLTVGTGLRDRAGNPLSAAVLRTFAVEGVPGFVLENRNNGLEGGATSLGAPGGEPTGRLAFGGSLPAGGTNPYDIAKGDLDGDGIEDLVVPHYQSRTVGILRGNGDGTFRTAVAFDANDEPMAVAVADLDDDGNLDVVVANYQSGRVSILLGDGNGALGEPAPHAVGSNPRDVEAADLDGDGVPEIITANSGQNTFTVLARASDGSYTRTNYTAASGVWAVAVGDVNGDGHPDVATANANAGSVSVFLGNGDGSFGSPAHYPVQNQPRHLVLGDLNGDGDPDLIVLNASSRSVSVLTGNGDGTFAEAVHHGGLGSDPYHLTLARLDGDDLPDVAVAIYGQRRVDILLNRGEGNLEVAAPWTESGYPLGIVAGDWNGDGLDDLATANHGNSTVSVWLGAVEESLTEDPPGVWTGIGRGNLSGTDDLDFWSFSARAGDWLTVAAEVPGSPSSSQLQYVIERPDGTQLASFNSSGSGWGQSQPVEIPEDGTYFVRVRYGHQYFGEYRLRVSLARDGVQMESEGNDSVGAANTVAFDPAEDGLTARVLGYASLGDAAGDYFRLGNLTAGTTIRLGYSRPATSGLAAVLEIHNASGTAVASSDSPDQTSLEHEVADGADGAYYARIVPQGGSGLLGQYLLSIQLSDAQAPAVTSMSLPDEGTTTSAIIDQFSLTFSEDMSPATINDPANYTLVSAGADGQFGNGDDIPYTVSPQAYASGLTAAYLIADGPLQPGLYRLTIGTGIRDSGGNPLAAEVVRTFTVEGVPGFVLENRSNDVESTATPLSVVTSGEPDGSVAFHQRLAAGGSNPYDIAKGDLNGDGIEDLVIPNYSSHDVSVFLGRGDGSFEPAVRYPANSNPIAVAVGDLNEDGHDDVVVANHGPNQVSILYGDGTGALGEPVSRAVGSSPRDVVLADLDGDGVPEILVANSGGNNFSLLTRQDDGSYARADHVSGSGVWAVAAGDLNDDGRIDVVAANSGAGNVSVFLGHGDGTFAAPLSYAVQSQPRDVAVGDLDGDGVPDLVVLNANSRSVSVLAGAGDGTFAAAIHRSGLGSEPYHLALGDLDGDGRPDVAVATYSSSRLEFLHTDTDGAPGPVVSYSAAENPIGVVIGDWNADGIPDAATANYGGDSLTVWLGNTLKPLHEDPPGLWTGTGRGKLANADDLDVWSFSGRAGDLLSVAAEVPGNPSSSSLRYVIERPDGSAWVTVTGSSSGSGESGPLRLPASGTYYVRVRTSQSYFGEYRFRVTLARGLQLESEDNNAIAQADVWNLPLAETGRRTGAIAGYIRTGDAAGDLFQLGNLTAGTGIRVDFARPASSPLLAVLEILDQAGSVVAQSAEPGDTSLSFEIPEGGDGAYHVRIGAAEATTGLLSQYVLSAELTDSSAPLIVSDTFPAEGSIANLLVDRFRLGFNEDMLAASVVDPANYELRASGPDGDFDTSDDVLYTVSPDAYSSGLSAAFVVTDGPLQPGAYRFTAGTGLRDPAGNALAAPYVRLFGLAPAAGHIVESRSNDTPLDATPLGGEPTEDFDGSWTLFRGYATGAGSYDIAAGDLNGDEIPDLVVPNYGASTVSVLLGNGDGTFRTAVNHATPSGPIAVAIGDADGDGNADIAIANHSAHNVSVLPGAGDGTFGSPVTVAVGSSPRDIGFAYLDSDDIPEIVVASSGQDYVTVLRRQANGTYARTDHSAAGGVWGIAIGDIDGDGRDDIVTANANADSVSVLRTAPDGTPGSPVHYPVGDQPRHLALGDVDGDGVADLVVLNAGSRTLSVLAGTGDGEFAEAVTHGGIGSDPYHIVLEDLDQDGDLDVAIPVYGSNRLEVWFNQGGASFSPQVHYPGDSNPIAAAAADFNGDGLTDLATANYGNGRVSVYLANRVRDLPEDSVGQGIRAIAAQGNIAHDADVDYWSFSGRGGDRVVVGIDTLNRPSSSGLRVQLESAVGTVLASFNAPSAGFQQTPAVTLPWDGTYRVRVSQNYDYRGEYRIRIVTAPPAVTLESDASGSNGSIQSANTVTLASTGETATGTAVGYIRTAGDVDYFDLGTIASGNTVFLNVRPLEGSGLTPTVSLHDANDGYLVEAPGGRAFDGVAEVRIQQTGRYYAVVRGAAGEGGLMDWYALEAQVLPTASVAFPNLQITALEATSTGPLQSGGPLTVTFTVRNVGALPTPTGNWTDRLVLSVNDSYGDADDIQLGVFPHSGVLQPGQEYTVTEVVTLPNGIDGEYFLIGQTDSGNAIPEFVLEADNVTVSALTLEIERVDYADLVPEALEATLEGNQVAVEWTTANRGAAPSPAGVLEVVTLRNLASNSIEGRFERTLDTSLAPGATAPGTATLPVPVPGPYSVQVLTDAADDVFEFDDASHASAEQNNLAQVGLDVTVDLQVANLRIEPDGELTSGAAIVVHWEDLNAGNRATAGSWMDRIVISNRTSGAVLLTDTLPYDAASAGPLAPGASVARARAFTLPDGPGGAGTIEFRVTTDFSAQVAEYIPGANAEANNTSVLSRTSTLGQYADLVVTVVEGPAAGDAGQPIEVRWTVRNQGNLPASGPWVDRILLSSSPDGASPQQIGSLEFTGALPPGETEERVATVTLPGNAGGNRYLVVVTDATGVVPETNDSNNQTVALEPTAVRRPNLVVTELSIPEVAEVGQSIQVEWTVENDGDGATFATSWRDSILISASADGASAQLLRNVAFTNTLAAGESVVRSADVVIPSGTPGPRYIVVRTDSGSHIPESDESDNSVVSETSLLLASPDLAIARAEAPAAAQFGSVITVGFTVTNAGTAAVRSPWQDRVYLSADDVVGGDLALEARSSSDVLPAGASAEFTLQVTLPATGFSEGVHHLFVRTDAFGAVGEADENNNWSQPVPITLTYPARPDLVVEEVVVPPEAVPGASFVVQWTVRNAGTAPAAGPWRDTLYVSADAVPGGDVALGTFEFAEDIAPGESSVRSREVQLPVTAPSGNVHVIVVTDSGGAVNEVSEANNAGVAGGTIAVPALLTIQPATAEVREGQSRSLTISRTGDRAAALPVSLTSTDSTELTVPSSVIIPAGQGSATFTVQAVADGIVDGTQAVTVTASATGFGDATARIDVTDAQVPQLVLEKQSDSVREGETLNVTVRVPVAPSADLPITLSSSRINQVLVPTGVIIPAGATSVDFMVMAVEDTAVEGDLAYTITASAAGHQSGSTDVLVVDNDVPSLALTLASASVREGDGPRATTATITRDVASDRALTVHLATDGAGLTVPSQVVIPANETSASFTIGVQDNDVVDPERTIRITGRVRDASGAVLASSNTAELTITDDDGPTLTLEFARSLVQEGLEPATSATLSRNTDTAEALEVQLESSNTAELVVPATVTIPAGEAAVVFDVVSVSDGVTDGNQSVTVTARAEGFTSGTATIVVSDVNLPDLVVTKVTGPAVAETDTYITIDYRVENQGAEVAGPRWTTRVFLSTDPVPGGDTLLGNYPLTVEMPPGLYFEQSVTIRAPALAGNYWIIVQTDVADEIAETLEDNNTLVSVQPVQVRPAYAAEVSTTLTIGTPGTPVPMSGRAFKPDGSPAPEGSLVNIHIRVRDTLRVISALVDRFGRFATVWQPLPNEAGAYEIGAAHPGEQEAPVQDSFVLLGMKFEPAQRSIRVIEESTVEGTFRLVNLSPEPLTGLTLEVLEQPSNVTLEADLSATELPGMGEVILTYRVTANDASSLGGGIHFWVESAEGIPAEAFLGVGIEPLRPQLVASPVSLSAAMLRGETRMVRFTVSNTGGRPTGPLDLVLPSASWLSSVSSGRLASLEPGESHEITLALHPPPDLALGPYQGTLYVGNDTVGRTIPFNFRAVSDAVGDLRVVVVDEYTYYAEGSPKVAGARVSVRDPFTHATIATGVTDEEGVFLASDLPESYYDIDVIAEKHTSYRQTFFVEPGITNELVAFVSRETVRYVWKVEPVEIEDHYKITIETEFETVVPTPVITVEPSVIDLGEITAAVTQVDIKITNHGLIQAENFRLHFPTHPQWEFTPLIEEIGVMPARSSLVVPLTIRKLAAGGPALMARSGPSLQSGGACHTSATATWELQCGPFNASYSTTISMPNASAGCGGRGPTGPSRGYGWTGGGGGGGGGGGPGGASVSGPSVGIKIVCDPKCWLLAGLSCVPGPVGCFFSGFSCGMGLGDGVDAIDVADCAMGAAGCLIPGASVPACIYSFARCFIQPAGGAPALASREFHIYEYIQERRRSLRLMAQGAPVTADPIDRFIPGVEAMLAVVGEIFGTDVGIWINSSAGPETGEWYQRFLAAAAEASAGGRMIVDVEREDLTSGVQPPGVHPSEVLRVLSRWNRTVENWARGIHEHDQVPAGESTDFIALSSLRARLDEAADANAAAQAAGFNDPINAIIETIRAQEEEGEGGGVCARIRLRLEQEAVITRDAFRATLEIDNQDAADLSDIEVKVYAVDSQGLPASDMFGIHPPELSGITAVDGSGVVRAGNTGSAKWLIVPTVDAAPEEPVVYYIAGEFSYTLGDTRVRIPLEPVSITVLPTPRLWIKYFHQRDVFSDDPFTDEIEPSIPFNLAVMVENRGKGAARNMRITSAQPEIIENEKGLLIDFRIIAAEVAGRNLTPSLTVNLGDIPPGATTVGRWLMTSTLQGLFTSYQASFEHIDGLGNPRLSLIEDLSIHEMIRLVHAGGPFEDGMPDFFVNQVPDPLDLGDTLYLSSGETNEVALVENAVINGTLSPGQLTVELVADMPSGWGYIRIPDPGNGQYLLRRVVREDGEEIPVDVNVWTTDRTFVGLGKRPKREHLLHLLDHGGPGVYTLHYDEAPAPDTIPPESQVLPLAATTPATFPVTWTGSDNDGGSGVAYYDIFVSVDGAPPVLWLQRTTESGALYTGEVGRQYAFFSRATDAAGNQEEPPGGFDSATTVTVASAAPVLDEIGPQTTPEDVPLSVAITLHDPDTPLDQLSITVDSSNRTLLPPGRVQVTGSGGERALQILPEPNRSGSTDVTVTVSDGAQSVSRTFQLTVTPVNDAPIAGDDVLPWPERGRTKISVAALLANDVDVEGEALRVTAVDPASAQGGVVSLEEGWVFYTPPTGNPRADSFRYFVSDASGAVGEGTVHVVVPDSDGGPTRNILRVVRRGDGSIGLRMFGIPGRTYHIQVKNDLTAPEWTTLQTVVAGPDGLMEIEDAGAVGEVSRFYRAYSP